MAGILTAIAACFLLNSMANFIIPAPPMDAQRNGAQQQIITLRTRSGDFVSTRLGYVVANTLHLSIFLAFLT